MIKTSKTVVFFGSGPVAAKSLELLSLDFEIEAVITKPSTLSEMSAITDAPTHSVSSRKELDEFFASAKFRSQVAVLIDFGIIVSQAVIDYFSKGIVNSHFSLLPQWRGADPITFAILSGQKQTGVSLMLLVEAMDEGPVFSQGVYDIKSHETSTTLTDYLIKLSHALLKHDLPRYLNGELKPTSQERVAKALNIPPEPTYSRKLTKADGIIGWDKSAEQIEREIRAFTEWPKSRTSINGLDVVITSSKVVKKQIEPCGKFWVENKQLFVSCGKDSLEILTLKPAGKRDMTAQAFLAGYGNRIV